MYRTLRRLTAVALLIVLAAPAPAFAAATRPRLTVVSASSGDMLTWTGGDRTTRFRVFAATSTAGPFVRVAEGLRSRSYLRRTAEVGYRYYRVEAYGPRIPRRLAAAYRSNTACNDLVSASADVGPAGGTLASSNGEVRLVVPTGALGATTTLVCSETVAPPLPAAIAMGDTYDLGPSGTAFMRPTELTLRYRVPVSHFQVASTLLKAVELVGRDGTGEVERVAASVDTSASTISGALPHFSYWSGAVIQPHGTTPAKVSYCSGICHDLVAAPGSSSVIPSRDPQVCYNCHGNTSRTLPPAGATGPNVQAELRRAPDSTFDAGTESRHPVTAGGLTCADCHDPHRDPGTTGSLLRSYDAVTGRAIASTTGGDPGSAYCLACHGTKPSRRIDTRVPGYWVRAGGNRGAIAGTPHDGIASARGGSAGCNACHGGHGAGNTALIRPSVNGQAVTGNDASLCLGCHTTAGGDWNGPAAYAASRHANPGASTRAATQTAESKAGAGACQQCHDPHDDSKGAYSRASGNDACFRCHDAAGVNLAGYGYAGRATYAASPHGGNTDIVAGDLGKRDFAVGQLNCSVVSTSTGLGVAAGKANAAYRMNVITDDPHVSGLPSYLTDGGTSVYMSSKVESLGPDGLAGSVVDLGAISPIDRLVGRFAGADTMQVMASVDGISYTSLGTTGTPGSAGTTFTLDIPPSVGRYVRFLAHPAPVFTQVAAYELYVRTDGRRSEWVSQVHDISDEATAGASTIAVAATSSAGTTVTVQSSVSLDGGTSWSPWAAATDGSPVADLPLGASLAAARARFRAVLDRSDTGLDPRLSSVSLRIRREPSRAASAYPGVPGSVDACVNCHGPHGTGNPNDTRATGDALCVTCHDAASASRPDAYTYRGGSAFSGSGHAAAGVGCSGCHSAHGTPDGTGGAERSLTRGHEEQTCFRCHDGSSASDIATYFAGSVGRSHHPVAEADQDAQDAEIECSACHNVHIRTSSKVIDPADRNRAYTATMTDQTKGEGLVATLPVIDDTHLDSLNPYCNYGSSPTLTVDTNIRTLFAVDTSTLPPDAIVIKAELYMKGTSSGNVFVRGAKSSWKEGAGTGQLNSLAIDGATWFERWYGDNAYLYTAEDWTVQGGEPTINMVADGAATSAGGGWLRLDMTNKFGQWRASGDAGILIWQMGPSSKLYVNSSNATSDKPYVRVEYVRGPVALAPTADTMLSFSDPTFNYGAETTLTVIGGTTGRILMKFDLSSIPATADIASARVVTYQKLPTTVPTQLHLMTTADWREGTGAGVVNSPAVDGATWRERFYGDNLWTGNSLFGDWLTAGADYVVTSKTDPIIATNAWTYHQHDVTEFVRTRSSDTLSFALYGSTYLTSRESPTPPRLLVSYLSSPTATFDCRGFCGTCHPDIIAKQWADPHQYGIGYRVNRPGQMTVYGPYYPNMGPLPCSECHDSHGSRTRGHLKVKPGKASVCQSCHDGHSGCGTASYTTEWGCHPYH